MRVIACIHHSICYYHICKIPVKVRFTLSVSCDYCRWAPQLLCSLCDSRWYLILHAATIAQHFSHSEEFFREYLHGRVLRIHLCQEYLICVSNKCFNKIATCTFILSSFTCLAGNVTKIWETVWAMLLQWCIILGKI